MTGLTPAMVDLLIEGFWETVVMVGVSAVIAVALGLPLALLLHATGPGGLSPRPWLNRPLGLVVNAVRSTPFIILMVAIVPFTRLVAGTSIGTGAAVVPLAVLLLVLGILPGILIGVQQPAVEAVLAAIGGV